MLAELYPYMTFCEQKICLSILELVVLCCYLVTVFEQLISVLQKCNFRTYKMLQTMLKIAEQTSAKTAPRLDHHYFLV